MDESAVYKMLGTDGVSDMTSISHIDENVINRNLRLRYMNDKFYTYTGSILIAINPYKDVDIYRMDYVNKYHTNKFGSLEPHIYAIAEAAYRNIKDNNVNQSCVISGESGAGKTETTKFVLQYLCSVTCDVSTWVQQQILEATTILEAFGNAKTVRNDNSSRFGKFMQVCFDTKNTIKGCIIQDYLLEQSRITFQSPGETNYHIFYQLVAEGQRNKEEAEALHLREPAFYKYLNASGDVEIDRKTMESDAKKFEGLRLAFQVLQIPQEMIDGLFRVLSAILWLGNLEFEDVDGENCNLSEKDKDISAKVAKLIGLSDEDIEQVCLKRQINVRGNITEIPLKLHEARENRHAMAKALYSRTFAFLINHINTCINPGNDASRFLGVLDIFGFENFTCNSFEQLCINYANEKLHKFFNHYVFALEQEIYKQEEIKFSHIEFTDNTQCLELIEKPPRCLLKILTEQCHMPKGSDAAYLNNLHSEFEGNSCYEKSPDRRHWESEFGIKHYAGLVLYKTKGFVDKNRDVQQDVFFDHMSRSSNCFVQELSSYQDLLSLQQSQSSSSHQLSLLQNSVGTVARGTSKGKQTVSDTFRYQLQSLVDVLQNTNPWYVRCIKPNSHKLPDDYDVELVGEQLRYLGMLDIIRIRREGYQIHMTFADFVHRYQCLTKRVSRLPMKDQVVYVMNELDVSPKEWQIGTSKVFLRSCVHEPIEEARKQVMNIKATIIQKHWRRYQAVKSFRKLQYSILRIQHAYKGWKLRINFLRKRRAAIVIQSHLRGVFAREVAAALREMRRMEEEMRKREKLEAEKAERAQRELDEQAKANELALAESERVAKQEIAALSQMAEQINSKFSSNPAENGERLKKNGNDSVDLDNLFAFLSESNANGQNSNSKAIINELDNKMNNLIENLDEELENVIQQELDGLTEDKKRQSKEYPEMIDENVINNNTVGHTKPTVPPTSLPPNTVPSSVSNDERQRLNDIQTQYQQQQQNMGKIGVPSLPEPTMPPPPVPGPNHHHQQMQQIQMQPIVPVQKKILTEEPIYEAVIHLNQVNHRDQNNMNSMNNMNRMPLPQVNQAQIQGIQTLPTVQELPEPVSTPEIHTRHRSKSPGMSMRSGSPMNRISNGQASPSSPKLSRPSSRTSSTGGHPFEREQRRKHRVEKKLQEMQSDQFDREKDQFHREDAYHDILEFAENFFNTHERSPEGTIMATLTRKGRKSVDMVPKYEMVTYYRGNSIPSSHIHMYDPENVSIACNIFKEFVKYIRGELSAERELQVIQYIIGQGIEREEVRDEIFIQIIRQATNCPSIEWTDRIWLLLCLVVVAFQPSKVLYKYFVSFLKRNLEQLDGKLRQYAQWCLDNCKNTKVRCRQHPPSSVEIAAMRRLGTIVCRFFFLDGRTKAIDVHPTDTAFDAVTKLAEKLALCNIEGWAIYQSRPDCEEHVKSHDYLYDIIAAWEIKQTKIQANVSTLRKNATLGSGENRFVFKKRLFKAMRELSQDPIEVNLLYAQAVYAVVKCDDFPVSEKVALQLAGLQAQVALGDPSNQPKPEYYSDIASYLPSRISKTREEHFWIPILAQAHRQYGAGRTELTAKVLYLSCVMQYPLYGSTMFPVSYKGFWNYGNSLILGINCEGVILIKQDDKNILYEFRYNEIESLLIDPSDSFITINLLRSASVVPEQQRCYVFETTQKHEIASLIVSYFPQLSTWITDNENQVKKSKGITNEDRVRLHHTVTVCRRQLIDSEFLRKPHDSSSGFLRNTLRRLSKHKLEKLRAEGGNAISDHGECYKGFPHAYWAFSKQALAQSLTKLSDQDEQIMLGIFQSILNYAGLGQSGEVIQRAEDEHITIIQSILERCMRKESFLNELYLQLIKQTTDHPDPNSRVNLRHWALLALGCSVVLPTQKGLRKYLLGHLKRCASDFVSEEGKYARFAEKCFMKTQATRRRQWPPSREEIVCTINRRPIYSRFYFMDGQFHSVEFHPSATAREVMEVIKKKIGLLEDAQGYAIYEVLGASDRSLLPDEKLADVMSKWEKYRLAATQAQNQSQNQTPNRRQNYLFLFKKHLFCDHFMNLADPVEKELLYHQVLHGLRSERFPISEMEAIMLTALQAQVELGDSCEINRDTNHTIQTIASHCLPPRFVPNIPNEGVAMHHQSLRGMPQSEAKQSFLNLIQSWPLHKATIFDVMQSFTSNWPRILWLAVDQKGLHLLEHRSRNTLCTYDYQSILSFSPNMNCLMIITGSEKKQSKIILTTSQAFQIANLIREYMEVMLVPMNGAEAQLGVPGNDPAEIQRRNQQRLSGASMGQRPGVIIGPNC